MSNKLIEWIEESLSEKIPKHGCQFSVFPKTNSPLVSVRKENFFQVAKHLRMNDNFKFNALDNYLAYESHKKLVLTALLRCDSVQWVILLRTEIDLPNDDNKMATFCSLIRLWPSSTVFEFEMMELFGIIFQDEEETNFSAVEKGELQRKLVPGTIQGFPLRKSFVVPGSVKGDANV